MTYAAALTRQRQTGKHIARVSMCPDCIRVTRRDGRVFEYGLDMAWMFGLMAVA